MASFLLLGLAAFVSTNVDDFVVLVALWIDPRMRRRDLFTGQVAATLALLGLGLAIARMALAVPEHLVRLIGVLPIGVGILKLFRRDSDDDEDTRPGMWWAPVLAVTLANGADNVAVYSALLVSRSLVAIGAISALFTALTLVWCEATRRIARHPKLIPTIERLGAKSVPWILIGIGVYLLVSRSGTFG